MTPIKAAEENDLRNYLEGLGAGASSPLSKVPGTHMARWLIAENFYNDPSYGQRKPETLAVSSLVFSSNFDGDVDSYLDGLCEVLGSAADEIWGRCVGYPAQTESTVLRAYLKHNQIDCGFFFAAYGNATVSEVKACLDQRDRLVAFATRSQGMHPKALQRAFIQEFAS